MSAKDMNERAADNHTRRRSKLEPRRRRQLNAHMGQLTSLSYARNARGAGKGDRPRTDTNSRLYELGYELSFNQELTNEQREQLTQEWERLKSQPH